MNDGDDEKNVECPKTANLNRQKSFEIKFRKSISSANIEKKYSNKNITKEALYEMKKIGSDKSVTDEKLM